MPCPCTSNAYICSVYIISLNIPLQMFAKYRELYTNPAKFDPIVSTQTWESHQHQEDGLLEDVQRALWMT